MRSIPIAALVLSCALGACGDAPSAAPADPLAGVRVIRPAEFAKYGIQPGTLHTLEPRASRKGGGGTGTIGEVGATSLAATYDYDSSAYYNGIFGGADRVQLITVQNGSTGVRSHSLTSNFYLQDDCTGAYYRIGGESFSSSNGYPVGLSSQLVVEWTSAWSNSAMVTGSHYFDAAPGYTVGGHFTVTFYSTDSVCV